MAVSIQEIQNYLAANPGLTDAQIVAAMNQYGVTPEQMAQATGVPLSEVTSRYEAIRPNYSTRYANVADEVAGAPGEQYIYGYSGPIGADDMYSAYSPTGELLGRYQASDDSLNALLPIAMALGGQFLFGGGLGGAGATGAGAAGAEALGHGAFLGEGIASGIPAWDAAALSAGNTLTGVSPALLDAQFIAADAAQLAAQTGNNVAAIQQNLIAAGVDPIVAATAADAAALGVTGSELITTIAGSGQTGAGLFTGGSAADLALGGITTTTGAPAGSTVPGGGTPTGGSDAGKTIADVAKGIFTDPKTLANLLSLLGGAGLVNRGIGGGGGGDVGSIPTQGLPQYTGNYFDTLQGFLNQYAPGRMPNQADYLADWYNQSGYSGVPAGMMTGAPIPSSGVAPSFTSVGGGAGPSSGITPIDYTLEDIVNAYKQSVRMGTMTEAEFVAEALRRGVKGRDLNRARDILLAE